MMFNRLGSALVVTLGMIGSAGATPVHPNGNNGNNGNPPQHVADLVGCHVAYVTTSTQCQRVSGNNDSVGAMNGFNGGLGVFGISSWLLADKAGGDEPVSLTAPFNLVAGTGLSGNWAVDSFDHYQYAAIVVKGGALSWVAYLLDLSQLSGTWSTQDILNNGGNQPALSHISLYVGGDRVIPPPPPPPPPPTVPVPASALLLLAGLGGLAALRRRG